MSDPCYVGNGSDDGEILGRDGGKVAFFDGTPATQPTLSGAITITKQSNAYGFSSSDLDQLYGTINLIRTALTNLGLCA